MENKIAYFRKEKGWSQQELADALNERLQQEGKVRSQDISMIESGVRAFSLKRLALIAEVLGVKPGDLLHTSRVASNATNGGCEVKN